ncbi:DEAD/DEAH box helicase, partial [Vagococcus lutrae]|uniref:DEAD/DEAH box helicase n=1 Tax=Vagococcus lutrae TaxID=81947 RepID=UPI0038B3FBB2
MSTFTDYQLAPFLMAAIEKKQFKQPTEVQQRLIPLIQKGRSVVGQSQTGSGKTHTFLLPLVNKIDATRDEVQLVVTAPSRELANQIYQEAIELVADAPETIRVSLYVGGTDKQRQLAKLENQQPHIVIGTPGRILDMMNEQALKVH